MVFVTASHCTEIPMWDLDSIDAHQPVLNNYVGFEVHDPNGEFENCYGFLDQCRNSDAALFEIEADSFDYGYIARTTGTPPTGYGQTGSITINTSNPRIPIVGIYWGLSIGTYVDKMGATTGWTRGQITDTCVDFPPDEEANEIRLCQYEADYGRAGGDSGAPVFVCHSYSGEAHAVGTHWGFDDENEVSYFSGMSGMQTDLGYLKLRDEPLHARITQLDRVPPDTYCTWEAIVSGGTLPYSYEWSGLFSGTGESVSGVVEEDDWLCLTVTDAADDEDSDQIYVEIDPYTWDC